MRVAEVEKAIRHEIENKATTSRIQVRKVGKAQHESLWMRMPRDQLRSAIRRLSEFGPLHLSVISGTDLGGEVELLYHFCVGAPKHEFVVTFAVPLSKKDLTIQTISDLVPGAVLTEREKQEFFGVRVEGIPDARRAFLTGDLADAHPWIRGDKATAKYARHVHERGVAK